MNKNIAVIGGGNGAHTMAADLVNRGFSVRMFEQSAYMDKLETLCKTRKIHVSGVMNYTSEIEMITDDMAQAIEKATYIAVVTPSFAHEAIAEQMKGIIRKDQVIILYPGAFGSLIFRRILGDECPVIAETNNLPYDTRLKGPATVFCSGINPINVAFFPASAEDEYLEEIKQIVSIEYVYKDVLECGLSLVNPALHSGACLINMGHMEQPSRGQFYMYEHFTPGAAKIDVVLDRERKAIGKAFGYNLRPIEDFAKIPQGEEIGWQRLYMQMHGDVALTPISGPDNIWSRYMTEDCPNGLVPWSALADAAGVETPTIDAVVTIYSHVHERDWWNIGRKLESLGLDGLTKDEILEYVATGEKKGK